MAKVVADTATSASDFSEAAATLALTVGLACHESFVAVLREELQVLRQRGRGSRCGEPSDVSRGDDAGARATIVVRTLDHLQEHCHEHDLSLQKVAASLGYNARYLTHLFTQVVGQHMHRYLVGLRVERASRELLLTDRPIKQIAYDEGFGDANQLVRAFNRNVGVTPSAYRRIFGGG